MSHVAALVWVIVYEQVAGAAAKVIHGRLMAALADEVAPARLALFDRAFGIIGLSAASGLA